MISHTTVDVSRAGRWEDVNLTPHRHRCRRGTRQVAFRRHAVTPERFGGAVSAASASTSNMLALMEAWSQLSTHLQQRPQPESVISSDDVSSDASTDASDASYASDSSSDAETSQLILAALKLAVRSLSRTVSDNSTSSGSSGGNSSPSTGFLQDRPPAGNDPALPAVQRSLALAVALAELYAAGLPLDGASIAAGIVAEAVDVSALHINTVQAKLGHEVAALVHDVLAVRHAPERTQSYDDASSSALRGWLLSAYDVRAAAIEVAWRWLDLAGPLNNIAAPSSSASGSSNGERPQHQQQLLAMEALTIYCPLGHALGLGVCAAGLEDAAFKVLFPSSYASTARQVLPLSSAAVSTLAACESSLTQALQDDVTFRQLASGVRLLGRAKSLYSIMRKLLRLQDPAAGSRRLGQMYDLLGLRAVVLPREGLPAAEAEAAAIQACYRLQEIAQQLWQPVSGRTKDYIAAPKPNGYQSLHSTLLLESPPIDSSSSGGSAGSSSGNPVVLSYLELQVRTAAMHAAAEGGDASHSGYKGRLERRQVRQLQQWTQQLKRRLAAPQPQTLLLTTGSLTSSSSSSSSSSSVAFVMSPAETSSSGTAFSSSSSSTEGDADSADFKADTASSSSNTGVAAAAAAPQAAADTGSSQACQQHEPAAAAAAAVELFQHLDLDGDGHLSLYELTVLLQELGVANQQQQQGQSVLLLSMQATAAAATAAAAGKGSSAPAAPTAPAAAAAASYAQQLLEQLDTNGDGLVSLTEFLTYYMTSVSSSSSGGGGGGGGTATNSSSSSSGSGSGAGSGGERTAGALWPSLHATTSSAAAPSTGAAAAAPPAATAFSGHLRHGSSSSSLHMPRAIAAYGSSRYRLSGSWQCQAVSSTAAAAAAVDSSDSDVNGSSDAALPRPAWRSDGSSSSSSSPDMLQRPTSPAVQQQQQVAVAASVASTGHSGVGVSSSGSDAVSSSSRQAGTGDSLLSSAFRQQQQEVEDGSEGDEADEDLGYLQQQQQQQQQQVASAQQLEELQEDLWRQQQRQVLRQQQQQLPTVLEDAAAGVAPSFVFVPVSSRGSSSNGASNWHPPLSAVSVTNCLGQVLPEIQLPSFGPFLITNAPQVFRSADVTVDVTTDRNERLLLQLEVVKPPGSETAILTARNLSRVVRRRVAAATVYVNGQPLLVPHGAAAEVAPGDVLQFGQTGVGFRVQQQSAPAPKAAAAAVQQYCGCYAQRKLDLELPVQEVLLQLQQVPTPPLPRQQRLQQSKLAAVAGADEQQQEQQQQLEPPDQGHQQQEQEQQEQEQKPTGSAAAAAAAPAPNAAAASDTLELQLRNVSRLVRTQPRRAEQQLATLAAANPTAAGPWFLWAQLAGGSKRPWMARDLYRAAAECQQQQMLLQAAADAAAGVNRLLAQQQQQQDLLVTEGLAALASATMEEEDALKPPPQQQQQHLQASATSVPAGTVSTSSSNPVSSGTNAAFSLTTRLIQILRSWGKLEWDQKLFGPSRRLWRLAANEAFKFPYEISATGGGSVLHCWATAEFERDNILNARVIVGEALRKCPRDAAVAVLAGSIEAAAGDVNAARALFLRAYQLQKADKQLYMAWPRMEGAAGNFERARALFQAGLSLYPNNTKILNLYACFEEEQGNEELARELHRNALDIDNTSITSMHNRVSWAGLELRSGNLDVCRQLLREGLDRHPDFPAALLLMARLERQSGNINMAEAFARRAQKADAFAVAAMRELQQIYAAKGERALSRNLQRHIELTESRVAVKRAGKAHGSTAWQGMIGEVREQEQQAVVEEARQRKRDLGLIRTPPRQQQQMWQAAEVQQHQRQQRQKPPPVRQPARSGQQQRHSKQQQAEEADGLQGFDFSLATQAVQVEAAAAEQHAKGRRRRQQLQQQ